MKKSLLALFAIGVTLNTFAVDIPRTSKYDDRMQYINYNGNDVTEIRAKDGFVTAISFSDGEEINDIAVGFSVILKCYQSIGIIHRDHNLLNEVHPKEFDSQLAYHSCVISLLRSH